MCQSSTGRGINPLWLHQLALLIFLQCPEVLIFVDMRKAKEDGVLFDERTALNGQIEVLSSGKQESGIVPPSCFIKAVATPSGATIWTAPDDTSAWQNGVCEVQCMYNVR